ncbi:hypothetical protein GP486_005247 [Trichoglossum hirsutum]|uniref:Uncharacterized protein n=1 Tax=Trichoglossum hirsutum TaxID=265104 RepID=A0A9P8RN17_9PEZI|nr:hypothetical protein GP486_005247 [Trichoglossum hirsutum]
MKRKINEGDGSGSHDASAAKRRAVPDSPVRRRFRDGFFNGPVLESYRSEYAESEPYKHGVIRDLVSDDLLQSVRNEILENLHFSPKETDI